MIVYRDTKFSERQGPPSWLDGCPEIHCREDERDGRLWGVGDAFLIGPAPDPEWRDVGDGWQARLVGSMDPAPIRRRQLWCDMLPATTLDGVAWAAPVILGHSGVRAFRVAYDEQFQPALTDEQSLALQIAQEARTLLAQAAEAQAVEASVAVRFAAHLLTCTQHISVRTIGALRLLDDALTLDTLTAATGFRKPRA